MVKRRMSVDLRTSSPTRRRNIQELKIQVSRKIRKRGPLFQEFQKIEKGTPEDHLRKEVLQEILFDLLNSYSTKMKTVPCKDHLIEKGIEIEKTLFRRASIDTYTNIDFIETVTSGVLQKEQLETQFVGSS